MKVMIVIATLGLSLNFLDVSGDNSISHQLPSSESACFVEHLPNSVCPYDELKSCIEKVVPDMTYPHKKDLEKHLSLLNIEHTFCKELKIHQSRCVHSELVKCTGRFDALDASQDLGICKEAPKIWECLMGINKTCQDPNFRYPRLIELYLDRVRATSVQCRIGYYNEDLCSDKSILRCMKQFTDNGANCMSSFRGYAANCIAAMQNRCLTRSQQRLVKQERDALTAHCP